MNDPTGVQKKKIRFGRLPEVLAVALFVLVVAAVLLFSIRGGDNYLLHKQKSQNHCF